MAHKTKFQRMFDLLKLLMGQERWITADLAKHLGCSRRTIFRDLADLHDLGVVCDTSSKDGVRLLSSGALRPINFQPEELLALQVTASAMPDASPLSGALRSAMERIRAVAGPDRRKLAQRMHGRIEIRPRDTSNAKSNGSVSEILGQALAEQRYVEVSYRSVYDQGVIQTKLAPYGQVFRGHAWYVIGHASLFDEIRVFRLDRFEQVRLTEGKFLPPSDFSVEEFFKDSWSVGRGQAHAVKIRFHPRLRLLLESSRQHSTQKISVDPDGWILFEAKVAGLDEIERWILGFGGDAEALEPPELRERIVTAIQAAIQRYESKASL